MKSEIEAIWKKLEERLSDEQVFYLLIMLLFSGYYEHGLAKHSRPGFVKENIDHLFRQVHPGIADTAKRLSERLDWNIIGSDQKVQQTIHKMRKMLSDFFDEGTKISGTDGMPSMIDRLDVILDYIIELAGNAEVLIATPNSIVLLMKELFSEFKPASIADFCCGSVAAGLSLWNYCCRDDESAQLYCTDINPVLCDIAIINLYAHGVQTYIVEQRDLLAEPQSKHRVFHSLIMDIPRGKNKSVPYYGDDLRLSGFNIKSIYSDWIFIEDALYHLSNQGQAMILATASTLIRANEKPLREEIICNDWLEAVITLPPNLYPNTRTGTELLIFNKKKRVERQNRVLFIDISKYYFRQQRNAYAISEEGLKYAVDSFSSYKEIEGISAIRETNLLSSSTCSFKPLQYIRQKSEPHNRKSIRLGDISQIVRGAQVASANNSSVNGDAYFINIKDIQDDRVVYETADRIKKEHPAYRAKFRIYEDDILITSKGTAIKMTIVESSPPEAYISGNITRIRVDTTKYDPYVLFEYLISEAGQIALNRIQSGTTIKLLSNGNLGELQVPSLELDKMLEIGGQLKQNRNEFLKTWHEFINDYQKKRGILTESIFKEE